ncbi:MAG: response regulator [Rhodobacteraceae bacterium]|nr:response regulator [Thioclava sp. L04-15]TNE94678.1 MAG: response regulator [Paracoccaceae bacterium]TNF16422.1 MAG: response regulator [Paracoccaceae bacterium]
MTRVFLRSVAGKANTTDEPSQDRRSKTSTGGGPGFAASGLLPKRCIIFCGDSPMLSSEIGQICKREDAELLVCSEGLLATSWLALHSEEIDVLMVDGDYLGEIEDTIDFCLRVRRASPALPVILVSSEMRADDFTCERMQACDVTLKSPISEVRLKNAIRAARQNNAFFLSRQQNQISRQNFAS